MKFLLVMLTIAAVWFLYSCDDTMSDSPPGPYSLTINFSAMDANMGRQLSLKVIRLSDDYIIAEHGPVKITNSAFQISLPELLWRSLDYHVEFYVDQNSNGVYDPPPADHAWRLTVFGADRNVVIEFPHNRNFTDIEFPVPDRHVLKVKFYQMSPLAGKSLSLGLINTLYGTPVAQKVITKISGDSLQMDLGPVLADGQSYQVDFYGDLNGNHGYDAPPVDQAWSIPLGPVSKDTTLVFTYNDLFTDIGFAPDSVFNCSLSLSGLDTWLLSPLVLRVTDRENDSIVSEAVGLVDFGGGFVTGLGEILQKDRSYSVEFYIDANTNGGYDPPPADPAWSFPLTAVSDTNFLISRTDDLTDIEFPPDSAFSLALSLKGMDSLLNSTVTVIIAETGYDSIIAERIFPQLSEADTSIIWKDIMTAGTDYRLEIHGDSDLDGMYSSSDSLWQMRLDSVSADISIAFNPGSYQPDTSIRDTAFTPQDVYELTITFTGMGPHVNQTLGIRVMDKVYGTQIASDTLPYVPQSEFSLTLGKVLVSGRSYEVEIFADYNNNGLYDSPPADFAWTLPVTSVTSDKEVTFAHNLEFTDIGLSSGTLPQLDIDFSAMDTYLGKPLQIKLIDITPARITADTLLTGGITSADFTMSFPDLLIHGHSYQADIHVDVNDNGNYDSPPVDHSWRLLFTADSDSLNLSFRPDTLFIDIGF